MSVARMMQMAAAGVPAGGGDVWTDPDLANASYDSVSFSVAGQDSVPLGLAISEDGSKFYVSGNTNDSVFQYNLSTLWDISSASYSGSSLSVSSQDGSPFGISFKPDGLKMYLMGAGTDTVYQYGLTTAWDISTASYDSVSFSVTSQDSFPTDVSFKPDGLKMYVLGNTGDTIFQYALSTAWDISTASYESKSLSVSSQEATPISMFISPTGSAVYVLGNSNDTVYQYDLGTAWDISTGVYNASQTFDVGGIADNQYGLTFKSDGSKMYTVALGTDRIYQYSTAAAAPAEWTDPDLGNASYDSVSFSVAGQDSAPVGLLFKTDGTKMYVTGQSNDSVYEYNLSTAWDISTASYVQNFSVGGEELTPQDLFFKPDGLKMYVIGSSGDDINEYNLSSAWDISTASYVQNFSVGGEETAPTGLFFKPDGTKLYVLGSTGDDINEYNLSSAWDVSTASYVQNFSVASQETVPRSLFFSPNGTEVYVLGSTGDDINEYNLSTPWDVSTASYVQNFSVASQETFPLAVSFKSDGSKMYVTGLTTDTIYQYSTA